MATITIEKLFGGFAPNNTTDNPVEGAEDQFSRSIVINPLRANFIGHMAPGELFTAITDSGNRVAEVPLNGVVNSDNEAFCVLRNGTVVQFGIGDDVVDGTYVVGTATVVGDSPDILTFRSSDGTEWIAWTYVRSDVNRGDIARMKVLNGVASLQDDDWFSTLTGGTLLLPVGAPGGTEVILGMPLRLWIGPDKLIYGTNGQYVLSHDPSTSNGNAQALNLGVGWVSVAGAQYNEFSAIIAYKRTRAITTVSYGETRLFLWDGFSGEPNHVYNLEDYYASGLKVVDGHLLIWTQGENNKTKVKLFTGNGITTIAEYSTSTIGDAPKQGGIESFRGAAHWCENSGNFFIAMVLGLGNGRYGLHEVMVPNTIGASPTATGMLRNFSSNNLYAGANLSGTYRILKINHSSYYTASGLRTRLIVLPSRSTLRKIKVYLSQFGSGASIQLSLWKDYNAVSIGGVTDYLNRTFTNAGLGTTYYVSFPVFLANVESFYMNINFNHASISDTAAIVRKIEVEYESTAAL